MKVKLINKKTKKTFELSSKLSEQTLIESCLNYYHSGYDYKLILFFHALTHQWKLDKFTYYFKLIEGKCLT